MRDGAARHERWQVTLRLTPYHSGDLTVKGFVLTILRVALVAAAPTALLAQTDEIAVYDGSLAAPRTFNLTLHNNYTPNGLRTPSFAGGVTPNHSWNGVAEWALGATDWMELGLYLPLYSHDTRLGFVMNGAKLRLLFATPHGDDRPFVYGANFEFSANAKRWDTHRMTSEVRGILAWHLPCKLDVIVNPIFDTAWDGVDNLEFVPATRVAYKANKDWTIAAETYSDFGALNGFKPLREQSQQLFGVVDHTMASGLDIEFGVGVGITNVSDRLTLKLMLGKELAGKR
jgi:hypothetical protein